MAKVSEIISLLQNNHKANDEIACMMFCESDIESRATELGTSFSKEDVREVLSSIQKQCNDENGVKGHIRDIGIRGMHLKKTMNGESSIPRKHCSGTREDIETYAPRG